MIWQGQCSNTPSLAITKEVNEPAEAGYDDETEYGDYVPMFIARKSIRS